MLRAQLKLLKVGLVLFFMPFRCSESGRTRPKSAKKRLYLKCPIRTGRYRTVKNSIQRPRASTCWVWTLSRINDGSPHGCRSNHGRRHPQSISPDARPYGFLPAALPCPALNDERKSVIMVAEAPSIMGIIRPDLLLVPRYVG